MRGSITSTVAKKIRIKPCWKICALHAGKKPTINGVVPKALADVEAFKIVIELNFHADGQRRFYCAVNGNPFKSAFGLVDARYCISLSKQVFNCGSSKKSCV